MIRQPPFDYARALEPAGFPTLCGAACRLDGKVPMAKFMLQAEYTLEGTKGLIRDGGSKRRAVVEKAVAALGGKLEGFYFSFGKSDVVIIVDLPDSTSAVAISLAVSATGSVKTAITPLITPEEMDAACKKQVTYTPPGA